MTSAVEIERAVCAVWGITRDELRSASRKRRLAWPRQAAMLLLRRHTRLSLPQIAWRLGNRDHTTVLYGVRAAADRLLAHAGFAARTAEAERLALGAHDARAA